MPEGSLSRDMLTVLFGPSADYVDDDLERVPHIRLDNLARIARLAIARLGDRIAAEGTVPPRLVGAYLEDGGFCSDTLAADYWGGVIASSRTLPERDDRGLRQAKLIARLTSYQIRTHYLFYATLRRLLILKGEAADFESRRYQMAVFVPAAEYMAAMTFEPAELAMVNTLTNDALLGLGMENLLDGSNTGSQDFLRKFFDSSIIQGDGIVYAPSLLGIKLFLWACGAGDRDSGHLLSPALDCVTEAAPKIINGCGLVYA